jgi:hypothetical protein
MLVRLDVLGLTLLLQYFVGPLRAERRYCHYG